MTNKPQNFHFKTDVSISFFKTHSINYDERLLLVTKYFNFGLVIIFRLRFYVSPNNVNVSFFYISSKGTQLHHCRSINPFPKLCYKYETVSSRDKVKKKKPSFQASRDFLFSLFPFITSNEVCITPGNAIYVYEICIMVSMEEYTEPITTIISTRISD